MQQINIYLMEYGWFQVIGRMMVCLALVFMAYKDVREHKVICDCTYRLWFNNRN